MRYQGSIAALLFVLAVAPTAAQVRVTTLALGRTPLNESSAVRLSRFADLTEVDQLKVGDLLSEGDLVTGLASELSVELTCPKGSLLRFTGRFRVVINPPEDRDCAVDLLSGSLDVLTDEPTKINLGGKILGSSGTRYAIELTRTSAGPKETVLVFEGKVEVTALARSTVIPVLHSMTFVQGTANPPEPQPVTALEIHDRAILSARFEVAKAQAAGVELTGEQAATTEGKFTALHEAVLSNPEATQPRLALAVAQVGNRLGDEALHNLRRGKIDSDKLLLIRPEGLKLGDPIERNKVDKILRELPPAAVWRLDNKVETMGKVHLDNPATAPGIVLEPPSSKFKVHLDNPATAPGIVLQPPSSMFKALSAPPSDEELKGWLAAGRFADVVAALEPKLTAGSASSRQELLLAEGYAGKGDAKRAADLARRALVQALQDRLLSADEIILCLRLIAGKS